MLGKQDLSACVAPLDAGARIRPCRRMRRREGRIDGHRAHPLERRPALRRLGRGRSRHRHGRRRADGRGHRRHGPIELVLYALGGCTGHRRHRRSSSKQRQRVRDFEVVVTGEQREETAAALRAHHHRVRGHRRGASRSRCSQRAIELSEEKYCSVRAMLGPGGRGDLELPHRRGRRARTARRQGAAASMHRRRAS